LWYNRRKISAQPRKGLQKNICSALVLNVWVTLERIKPLQPSGLFVAFVEAKLSTWILRLKCGLAEEKSQHVEHSLLIDLQKTDFSTAALGLSRDISEENLNASVLSLGCGVAEAKLGLEAQA